MAKYPLPEDLLGDEDSYSNLRIRNLARIVSSSSRPESRLHPSGQASLSPQEEQRLRQIVAGRHVYVSPAIYSQYGSFLRRHTELAPVVTTSVRLVIADREDIQGIHDITLSNDAKILTTAKLMKKLSTTPDRQRSETQYPAGRLLPESDASLFGDNRSESKVTTPRDNLVDSALHGSRTPMVALPKSSAHGPSHKKALPAVAGPVRSSTVVTSNSLKVSRSRLVGSPPKYSGLGASKSNASPLTPPKPSRTSVSSGPSASSAVSSAVKSGAKTAMNPPSKAAGSRTIASNAEMALNSSKSKSTTTAPQKNNALPTSTSSFASSSKAPSLSRPAAKVVKPGSQPTSSALRVSSSKSFSPTTSTASTALKLSNSKVSVGPKKSSAVSVPIAATSSASTLRVPKAQNVSSASGSVTPLASTSLSHAVRSKSRGTTVTQSPPKPAASQTIPTSVETVLKSSNSKSTATRPPKNEVSAAGTGKKAAIPTETQRAAFRAFFTAPAAANATSSQESTSAQRKRAGGKQEGNVAKRTKVPVTRPAPSQINALNNSRVINLSSSPPQPSKVVSPPSPPQPLASSSAPSHPLSHWNSLIGVPTSSAIDRRRNALVLSNSNQPPSKKAKHTAAKKIDP